MVAYFFSKINWICLSIDCKAIHIFRACTLSETTVVSEEKDMYIYFKSRRENDTLLCYEWGEDKRETCHSCMLFCVPVLWLSKACRILLWLSLHNVKKHPNANLKKAFLSFIHSFHLTVLQFSLYKKSNAYVLSAMKRFLLKLKRVNQIDSTAEQYTTLPSAQ